MYSIVNSNIEDNLSFDYLIARNADIYYGFHITQISKIIPIIEITSLDTANITGVITLKDENIPVYELNCFFNKDSSEIDINQKLIIVKTEDNKKMAFIVDDVKDITSIAVDKVLKLPVDENDMNFVSTAVAFDKTVFIIDVNGFADYVSVKRDKNKKMSCPLAFNDKNSLEVIKNRTELLNRINQQEVAQTFLKEKFVIFSLGTENYAFNINFLSATKRILAADITNIPCVPDFILGIINADGNYLTLFDIKTFLNIPKSELNAKIDVLIINVNDYKIAVWVDKIIDIANIDVSNINFREYMLDSFISSEVSYNDKMINILNIEKLFSTKNINVENY